MNTAEAISALQEQAFGTRDARGSGFADVEWRFRQHGEPLVLSVPWRLVSESLQVLAPQARAWAQSGVPMEAAYAVGEIVTRALDLALTEQDPAAKESLTGFAWRVACGWEAVLSGDTDDVAEHVRDEAHARGIPPLD